MLLVANPFLALATAIGHKMSKQSKKLGEKSNRV